MPLPTSTENWSTPSRVNLKAQAFYIASTLPNGTKAFMLWQNVDSGDEILSIKQPILAIVKNTKSGCETVCDNCFATVLKQEGNLPQLRTTADDEKKVPLIPCDFCNVMHYCNKDCRDKAWAAHHKYECCILQKIDQQYASKFEFVISGLAGSPVWRYDVRSIVRLIMLYKNEKISSEEFADFTSIRSAGEGLAQKQIAVKKYIAQMAKKIHKYTEAAISIDEIDNLLSKIGFYNFYKVPITLPLIKAGTGCFYSGIRSTVDAGFCTDPFISLINHNCEANTCIVFQGGQLKLRARRHIKKGEELTIRYTPEDLNSCYFTNNKELLKAWGVRCSCVPCKYEDSRPEDCAKALRILRTLPAVLEKSRDWKVELQKVSGQLILCGFNHSTRPMWEMYQTAMNYYFQRGMLGQALAIALKTFLIVEPFQHVPLLEAHRTNTLHHLIVLWENYTEQHGNQTYDEKSCQMLFVLLQKLADRIEMTFGSDSEVFTHTVAWIEEKKEVLKEGDPAMMLLFNHLDSLPILKGFESNIKVLMSWAGFCNNKMANDISADEIHSSFEVEWPQSLRRHENA